MIGTVNAAGAVRVPGRRSLALRVLDDPRVLRADQDWSRTPAGWRSSNGWEVRPDGWHPDPGAVCWIAYAPDGLAEWAAPIAALAME